MVLVSRASDYDTLAPLDTAVRGGAQGRPGDIDTDRRKYAGGYPSSVSRSTVTRPPVPAFQRRPPWRWRFVRRSKVTKRGKLRQGKDERLDPRAPEQGRPRGRWKDVLQMTIWTPSGPVALGDLARVEHGEGLSTIEGEDRERPIGGAGAAPDGRLLGEPRPRDERCLRQDQDAAGRELNRFDGQVSISRWRVAQRDGRRVWSRAARSSCLHRARGAVRAGSSSTASIMADHAAARGSRRYRRRVPLKHHARDKPAPNGTIFLLGLVTKNAILVVDRAIVRVREHGETPFSAILEAGPEAVFAQSSPTTPRRWCRSSTAPARARQRVPVHRWRSQSSAASLPRRSSSLLPRRLYLGVENAKARSPRGPCLILRDPRQVEAGHQPACSTSPASAVLACIFRNFCGLAET